MKLGIHAYAWCSQWSNETLQLTISDDMAEYIILREECEVEMALTLRKEDGNTWRIVGTSPEECSYESFTSPYGDDCDDGTEIALVTIDGGSHVLYQGEGTDIDTTRLAWDFMKRFAK